MDTPTLAIMAGMAAIALPPVFIAALAVRRDRARMRMRSSGAPPQVRETHDLPDAVLIASAAGTDAACSSSHSDSGSASSCD